MTLEVNTLSLMIIFEFMIIIAIPLLNRVVQLLSIPLQVYS